MVPCMSLYDSGSPAATGNAFNIPHEKANLPFPAEAQTTQKQKVELWFVDPLNRMGRDDAFACLMVCFPLIEAIIRFELEVADAQDVTLSDNSPALHGCASFMCIPEREARDVWDAFRNGLLHRAMIKSSIHYTLTDQKTGRPAEFKHGIVLVYVWELRDAVVAKLKKHHAKLWRDSPNALPKIHLAV